MTPRVSIIFTTFNEPRYLRRALLSIFSQSFTEWELIIINDASPHPETAELLRELHDPRVTIITNPRNLGPVRSPNIGLAQAKGEFIARLDDDDCWVDDRKLALQVNFLDAHPEHAVIGTNIIVHDFDSDKELYRTDYPQTDEQLRRDFYKASPFAHSAVLIRRAALQVAGPYDESLRRVEDYDLWLRIGRRWKLANLQEPMVIWRAPSKTKKNVQRIRVGDQWTKLKILWRYRNDYPNFWLSYSKDLLRLPTYLFAWFVHMR